MPDPPRRLACESLAGVMPAPAIAIMASVWSLVTKVRRCDLSRCSLCSDRRGRARSSDAVPLPRCFQRIRRRLGAVKITPIDKRCAGCRGNQNKNEQEKRGPFHALDANRSATHCQCSDPLPTRSHLQRSAAAFLSCASLWCKEISPPSGAMD